MQIAQAENVLGNYMIKPAFMLNDEGMRHYKTCQIAVHTVLNVRKSMQIAFAMGHFVPGHKREGRKEGKSNKKLHYGKSRVDINILFENNASYDNKILGLNETKITFPIHVELAKNNPQIPPAMKEIVLTSVDGKPTIIDLPLRNGGCNVIKLKPRLLQIARATITCFNCDVSSFISPLKSNTLLLPHEH